MRKQIVYLLLLLPSLLFAQPLDRVVALVNDGVITASELDAQQEILEQQMRAKKLPIPDGKVLRKQVLQHLIDVDLELQLAKQNGLSIDDMELNDTLTKIARDNKLSLAQLREAIEQQAMVWDAYRENIRKELLIARLQQKAVGKEVNVTPKQIEDYLKNSQEDKANYTYQLQNILIPLPEEPTTEQVSKALAKAKLLLAKVTAGYDFSRLAIEESSGEFALEGGDLGERHLAELPEIFAKEVVKMKIGGLAGPLRTGNGFQLIKLIAIGGTNEKHIVTKTHVRHILLKPDVSMTPAEAEKQIANLYQQLKSGKNFAEMAKQYSLDTSSAVKGGDLGWVNPGDLVPAFEEAMDKLPVNTLSQPIKTVYGWHLIEVLERKEVDDSDSYKKQKVRQFLQQRKFTEAVYNWQQHMRSNAYVKIIDKELA